MVPHVAARKTHRAVLRNFVRPPKKTFATISAKRRHLDQLDGHPGHRLARISQLTRCASPESPHPRVDRAREVANSAGAAVGHLRGGTQRLPRIIGEAKALEMILRGLTVTGPGAYELGMVHEVVDDPFARALELAAELGSREQRALPSPNALLVPPSISLSPEGLAEERRSFGAVMRTASSSRGSAAGVDRPKSKSFELCQVS